MVLKTKERKKVMKKIYEKPVMTIDAGMAEGIYAASGSKKCDSKYMNGVWQAPDYSDWNGGTRGYKQQFGCLGCPANTDNVDFRLIMRTQDMREAMMLMMEIVCRAGRKKAMDQMIL